MRHPNAQDGDRPIYTIAEWRRDISMAVLALVESARPGLHAVDLSSIIQFAERDENCVGAEHLNSNVYPERT